MSFFHRSTGPKRTAIDVLCEDFEAFYCTLPADERTAAQQLIRAILQVTERSNFSQLSAGLMKFVLRLLPHVASGSVGHQLVVGLDASPSFRRDVCGTLGEASWVQRVRNARSALS